MRVPNYPSNREADERAKTTAQSGKVLGRMKPSRETCLHMTLLVRVFLICISHVEPRLRSSGVFIEKTSS
jgi:hypothetical protein